MAGFCRFCICIETGLSWSSSRLKLEPLLLYMIRRHLSSPLTNCHHFSSTLITSQLSSRLINSFYYFVKRFAMAHPYKSTKAKLWSKESIQPMSRNHILISIWFVVHFRSIWFLSRLVSLSVNHLNKFSASLSGLRRTFSAMSLINGILSL